MDISVQLWRTSLSLVSKFCLHEGPLMSANVDHNAVLQLHEIVETCGFKSVFEAASKLT